MLKVNFSKAAQKVLTSLLPKHAHQCALKIQALRIDPLPHDTKTLRGTSFLRCDIGEYRIIYQHNEEMLEILLIDKRNDDRIYKKMKRLK